jgi:hypothetical protein
MTTRSTGARGSATLELAVLLPAVLILLALVTAAARLTVAAGAVEQAAAAGARQASLVRSAGTAQGLAVAAVRANLAGQGVGCSPLEVAVAAAALQRRVGESGQVAVTVSCSVPLADLGVPGLPGSRRIERVALSPVERYRGR